MSWALELRLLLRFLCVSVVIVMAINAAAGPLITGELAHWDNDKEQPYVPANTRLIEDFLETRFKLTD